MTAAQSKSMPALPAAETKLHGFGAWRQIGHHGPVGISVREYLQTWTRRGSGQVVDGDPDVWTVLDFPAFDHEVLGRTVARVRDIFMAVPCVSVDRLAGHMRGLATALGGAGADLVLAEAWQGEKALARACAQAGFSAGAERLRWIRARQGAGGRRLRTPFAVRTATPQDLAALLPLAQRFDAGQYEGVDDVGPSLVASWYAAWMARAWRGEFADEVLVAEGRTGPCAFASFKLRGDLLVATGRRIMGAGLAAVARGAEGALVALVSAMMARVDAGDYDGVEFDMYAGNEPAQRCLQAFDFRCVDAARIYHLCPGRTGLSAGPGAQIRS